MFNETNAKRGNFAASGNVIFPLLLMVLLLTLLSNQAFASSVWTYSNSIFEPSEKDISLGLISQLFGSLVQTAGSFTYNGELFLGHGLDPFQALMTMFNTIVLVIATMVGGLTILTGVVNTGSEGVMLGKDLGNPFYIGRSSLAIAMLLPIKGYCIIQIVIMWLVIHAIGMASNTWQAFLNLQHANTSGEGSIADSWLTRIFGDSWSAKKDNAKMGSFYDLYSLKMPNPDVGELVYKAFEGYACQYGLGSEILEGRFVKRHTELAEANRLANVKQMSAALNGTNTDPVYKEKARFIEMPDTHLKPDGRLGLSGSWAGTKKAADAVGLSDSNLAGLRNLGSKVFHNSTGGDIVSNQTKALSNEQKAWQEARNTIIQKQELERTTVAALGLTPTRTNDKTGMYLLDMKTDESALNGQNNQACGFIDFSRSVNSFASTRLWDNVEKGLAERSFGGNTQELKSVLKKQADSVAATSNGQSGSTPSNVNTLAAYAQVYGNFQNEIRNIAREYVQTINERVRFPEWSGNDVSPYSEKASTFQKAKQDAMLKAAKQLDTISHHFEQQLIDLVYKQFNSSKQEMINKTYKRYKGGGYRSIDSLNIRDKNNYVGFMGPVEESAKQDGWAMAGAFYMSMIKSINQLHTLLATRPALGWASQNGDDYARLLSVDKNKGMPEVITNASPYENIANYYGFFSRHSRFSSLPKIAQDSAPIQDSANSMAALAMGIDVRNMYDTQRHPVIILVEAGHNLLSAAEKFMNYSSYWQTKSRGFVPSEKGMIPNPANPASQTQVMVSYMIGAIMMLGFAMAFYLPALPLLVWFGAVIGWLISVFEAIIISPLWLMMHIFPGGDKFTGKGQAGYGRLFGILLTPTLIIIGLAASIVLTQVVGIFVNYVYGVSMGMSLDSDMYSSENMGFTKFASVMAIYFIYAIFMFQLLSKMFNLITIIPDHILKWIGSQQGSLSEYGALGGAETYGKLSQLGSPAGNAAAQRYKESGEAAALSEAQGSRNVGAAAMPTVPNTGTSGVVRSTAPSGEASGIGVSSGTVSEYSGVPVSGQLPYRAYEGSPDIPPVGQMQQQQYSDLYQNSYRMAEQTGMNSEQAHNIAQQIASKGYDNSHIRGLAHDWNNREIMKRYESQAQAQEALTEAASKTNGKAIALSLTENARANNLSSSNAQVNEYAVAPPVTNGQASGVGTANPSPPAPAAGVANAEPAGTRNVTVAENTYGKTNKF